VELNITWGKVLRVWWSFTWRTAVGGAALGMIAGLIAVIAGMEGTGADTFILSVGLAASLPITIICFRMILGKRLGRMRLVLVESEADNSPSGQTRA
jgi:hypothetical protein